METKRTKNYISNISLTTINKITLALVKFIIRTFFIKYLGETLLGVNGLFTNVLSILSLAELGISTTIGFSLYKPLADKNEKAITAFMNFYKKIYNIVAIVMTVLGIAIIPLLKYIIKEYEEVKLQVPELNVIYLLFVANTVITYIMAYKRTLITADQKEYKITGIVVAFNIVLGISQVITLVLTKNYILFLIVQILVKILENIFVNMYVDKKYTYLKKYKNEVLEDDKKKNLFDNIRAIFIHKISDTCIYSTDNIIISKFISVVTVGVYSNYLLISDSIKNFLSSLFWNLTASFGNLLVTEDDDKKIRIFDVINFSAICIYQISAIVLFALLNPIVNIWLGEKYLLNERVVLLIAIEFMVYGITVPISMVKSSAGFYIKDKYISLITAGINLIVSIVLVNPLGLEGVIIGTIACEVLLPMWYRPILIYKYVLKRDVKGYYFKTIKYILMFTLSIVEVFLFKKIQFNNLWINLAYIGMVAVAIGIINPIVFFGRSKEYAELKNRAKGIIKKIKVKFVKNG